ncbi:MAG: IclR family transcriptional regulator [Ancalomicrobiaceae bacterium]|nr:IclR family transcriptional regulator [Ancalomicrobiaceae bacterium]
MRVVQTLLRGLEVLDFVAEAGQPVRNLDVAERFGIDKANASRLLLTLTDAGYVTRSGSRGFVPGPKMRVQPTKPLERLIGLRQRSRSVLEELVRLSGECAHIAVLVGDKVWYIDEVSSPHPLKVDHPVGSLAPLHCTALGKAYLAFSPEAQVKELTAFTTRTLTSREALEADIRGARTRGYAVDDEEFSLGVRCVAAPVMDANGVMLAAIGVSGPTARTDRTRLEELGKLVVDRCAQFATEPG